MWNGKTWISASILVIFALSVLMFYEVRGQVPAFSLMVVTYNVGTPRRGEKIPLSDVLLAVKSMGAPDLLMLQEVHGEKEASGIAEKLGLGYFVYANYNPLKAGDGLAIVSRYPLSDPRLHHFKACRWAWFSAEMVVKGEPFLVCSVHLERIHSVVFSGDHETVDLSWKKAIRLLKTELMQETPRTRGVDEFLVWLESHRSERVIIGGDFNTVPFSTAIRKMGNRYDDTLWPGLDYLTGTYQKISLPIAPRIDYIFHSPDIKCRSASVIRHGAGDHRPVRAELDLG